VQDILFPVANEMLEITSKDTHSVIVEQVSDTSQFNPDKFFVRNPI